MRRLTPFFIAITFLGPALSAQNLVQNPSFEHLPTWDTLWFLSTVAPSSPSAVATHITTDGHDGTNSVELSNTLNNKYTYYYSDSIKAALSFIANKSYEVRGWIKPIVKAKSVEFSMFWGASMQSHLIYTGSPDPATQPDWFMVKDTITPDSIFSDGYLRIGIRAAKGAGPTDGAGQIRFDDFSVVRIPDNNETKILSFSIPGQAAPALVDTDLGTLTVTFAYGTDLTSLAPDVILLSRGALISPAVGEPQNFMEPLIYTVTAQDEVTTQDYEVIVNILPNTETDITDFVLLPQTGPASIDNVNHTVDVEVDYGTDLSSLVPGITLSYGATVDPGSGTSNDFTSPASYTVTAEDGLTSQLWTVSVTVAPASSETDITVFTHESAAFQEVIDNVNHTVEMTVVYGTDISNLAPTILLSEGATIDPISGSARDFTNPVIYTVTAQDGTTTQDWTITVLLIPNTAAQITSFTLPEQASDPVIDTVNLTITVEVPFGTDVTILAPLVAVSEGATVDPASGVATDFTSPAIYTVTAMDEINVQEWTVTVSVLQNTEALITGFSIPEQASDPVINAGDHTVTVEVPFGTSISSLVPEITVSEGASIDPASGVAADFTSPVTYTVTAQDGITQLIWTVTVSILPNTDTDITEFTLDEQTGPAVIDNSAHTVGIEVYKGASVTSLTPTIKLSPGATVSPSTGEAMDFSNPVVYVVTAEDGITTQQWTVTVSIAVTVRNPVNSREFIIYPNPVSEVLYVEMEVPAVLRISDITGKIIWSKRSGAESLSIPVHHFGKGIYFMQVNTSLGIKIEKFVVK